MVVTALAEPAVVHDQHLNAQLSGFLGELHQLGGVKVKIGGLPAVDEQGTLFVGPLPVNQVLVVQPVEGAAHAAQALLGEDHHSLWGLKALARLQAPAEGAGLNASGQPGAAQVVHLHLKGEIAAVYQAHANGLALLLACALAEQRGKGVIAVAGHAPAGGKALAAMAQGGTGGGVLFGPAAVYMNQIIVHGRQIQAQAHDPLQIHRPDPGVFQPHASGNGVMLGKDCIEQMGFYPSDWVQGLHLQGLGLSLLGEGGGQTLQSGLAGVDFMGNIAEIRYRVSGRGADLHSRDTVIPAAGTGKLLGGKVQGEGAVSDKRRVAGGEGIIAAPVHQASERGHIRDSGAVVEMGKVIFGKEHKSIGRGRGIQLKDMAGSVESNGHGRTPFVGKIE